MDTTKTINRKLQGHRTLSALLALLLILALLPLTAFPQQAQAAVGSTFTANSGNIAVAYKVLTEDADAATGTVQVGNDWSAAIATSTFGALTIPATVESDGITYAVQGIGDYAFWDCGSLPSIAISDSVTSVGQGAFTNCSKLVSVTMGSSVKSIANYAFQSCASLTSLTIPAAVESIGSQAFRNCPALATLTFEPSAVPALGVQALNGPAASGTLYYPADGTGYVKSRFESVGLPSGWTLEAVGGGASPSTEPHAVSIDGDIVNGTIEADMNEALSGTTVTLTATPDEYYRLTSNSLTVNGGDVEVFPAFGSDGFIFTMPDEEAFITASFEYRLSGGPPQDDNGYYQLSTPADLQWLSQVVDDGYRSLNAILTADIDLTGVDLAPIGGYGGVALGYSGTFDGAGYAVTINFTDASNRGGIFGTVGDAATIKNLTVRGSISSTNTVGVAVTAGIAARGTGTFINCTNEATVSGISNVGGIAGISAGAFIDCVNTGDVTGNGSDVGGLFGSLSGSATGCVNTGTVTNSGGATALGTGGIAGALSGASLIGCTNRGQISGQSDIGGIVGRSSFASTSTISACVNEGAVSAISSSAGIVGSMSFTTVTRCVNFGDITSLAGTYSGLSVAGIVGTTTAPFTINDNYNGGTVTCLGQISYLTQGMAGILGTSVDRGGSQAIPIADSPVWDNYNSGAVLYRPGGNAATPPDVLGPITGVYGVDSNGVVDLSNVLRNVYAADSIEEGTSVKVGTVIDESNAIITAARLRVTLAAAGVTDEVKYNVGGYPVPERLWDGVGTAPEGEGGGEPVLVRFNVTPEDAAVEVSDNEGTPLEPLEPGGYTYELISNQNYRYTVSTEGYTSQTKSSFIIEDTIITVGLHVIDTGQYVPGWGKWRPSFGIYITNPDGISGTRIGNWVYDEDLATYVDADTREVAPFIEDFSDDPLIYTGVDRYSAARLGVVKTGIKATSIIEYYNAYVYAHPELELVALHEDTVDDFTVSCATNSSGAEDPYASNDPTNPGRWAWTGWDDSLTETARYYYPAFVTGVNNWGGGGGSAEYKEKDLGQGVLRESVLAITSFNDRIMRLPQDGTIPGLEDGDIDDEVELNAAIDYLLSIADTERALRNFTGMLPDNSMLPLGADDSYFVGSVWITAPGVELAPEERVTLDAPELSAEAAEATATSVTLAVPDASVQDPDAVLEYRVYQEGGSYGAWQTSPFFEGLESSATYLFQARYVATDTEHFLNSAAGTAIEIRTLAAGPSVGEPSSGDLDGDGTSTTAEALQIARATIYGYSEWSAALKAAADINGDGVLTMSDAYRALRAAIGL